MTPCMQRAGESERGSVSILVAAVLALAAALALVSVDLLGALHTKARAQTAADAAALAAAQQMVLPSAVDPSRAAREFARRNGATLVACDCPAGGSEAVVEVTLPVPMIFLAGMHTVRGRARAVVEWQAAAAATSTAATGAARPGSRRGSAG